MYECSLAQRSNSKANRLSCEAKQRPGSGGGGGGGGGEGGRGVIANSAAFDGCLVLTTAQPGREEGN